MNDPNFPFGRIHGVPLRVHRTWFVTVGLITLVLATGYFPKQVPTAPSILHWWLGLMAALGLFASILLHELAHAFVAQRLGLSVTAITLHALGGLSHFEQEPPSPRVEFWIAIAGPMTSYVLALGIMAGLHIGAASPGVAALLRYVVGLNLTIGTFNLVPGLPLDGGRLLRAGLWAWHGNRDRATRPASHGGVLIAAGLVALGGIRLVHADVVGGLWLVAVGLFLGRLRRATDARVDDGGLKQALEGLPVRVAMTFGEAAASSDLPLDQVVRRYFGSAERASCPVVGPGGMVIGIVTARAVAAVPQERWPATPASGVMSHLREDRTIAPAASCWEALRKLRPPAVGRLIVIEDGRLLGTVGLDDLVPLLTWSRWKRT